MLFNKIIFIALSIVILMQKSFALSLIRDAQTENFLKKLSAPVFAAANLTDQVELHIINDDSINAFVAGGKNIFINTGTITYADSPLGLLGIIAHETGHITGSHLARMSIDMKTINNQLALGYILGIASAIAGSADAAQALILGSSQVGERNFYSFSTKHEEAADEAALQFLDQAQISSQGLLEFFKEIKNNEKIYFDTINPYTRTHPLTDNRISRISRHIEESQYSNYILPADLDHEFKIIKVKLQAFLEDPNKVLEKYDINTELGLLATIIAKHRMGQSVEAIDLFKKLPSRDDPYMQELKGQIYYEMGDPYNAVKVLNNVEREIPDNALIKIELAAAILSMKETALYAHAITQLRGALLLEPNNVQGWRILAEIFSGLGKKSFSMLALAEGELVSGNYEKTLKYAKIAQKDLIKKKEKHAKKLARIEDIITISENKIKGK